MVSYRYSVLAISKEMMFGAVCVHCSIISGSSVEKNAKDKFGSLWVYESVSNMREKSELIFTYYDIEKCSRVGEKRLFQVQNHLQSQRKSLEKWCITIRSESFVYSAAGGKVLQDRSDKGDEQTVLAKIWKKGSIRCFRRAFDRITDASERSLHRNKVLNLKTDEEKCCSRKIRGSNQTAFDASDQILCV